MSFDSDSSLSYLKRKGSIIYGTATAPGGAVAVLRISGDNLEPLKRLVGDFPAPGTFSLRTIKNPNHKKGLPESIDKALVLFFKAPHSFTGEDVIEIQGHGSSAVLNLIEEALGYVGAYKALPGEFSFRAVLNNQMTLAEAEKLNMVLRDDSLGSFVATKLLTDKGISNRANEQLNEVLGAVVRARGRVEAAIDFPEAEEEQSGEIKGARELLWGAIQQIHRLLTTYENFVQKSGEPTVLILGPPNVGKSTLLNRLSGGERSLVSHVAGTTRDFIDARLLLPGGRRLKIIDTAGIRDLVGHGAHDDIEKRGIGLAIKLAESASVIVWVEKTQPQEVLETKRLWKNIGIDENKTVVLKSHADLVGPVATRPQGSMDFRNLSSADESYIYSEIEKVLSRTTLGPETDFESEGLVSGRQARIIENAAEDLRKALVALDENKVIEIVGEHLLGCERMLKAAIGREVGEEYLGAIFSQFCLGK